MSNTKIPVTSITKYRALMLVLATEKGFRHSQSATNVDVFTKGAEVITLVWGATKLASFSAMDGKTLKAKAEGTVAGKLQRAQSAMGKPMASTAKWRSLKDSEVVELEKLAVTKFKVVAEAAKK